MEWDKGEEIYATLNSYYVLYHKHSHMKVVKVFSEFDTQIETNW